MYTTGFDHQFCKNKKILDQLPVFFNLVTGVQEKLGEGTNAANL